LWIQKQEGKKPTKMLRNFSILTCWMFSLGSWRLLLWNESPSWRPKN
jgi:hypothetical protein